MFCPLHLWRSFLSLQPECSISPVNLCRNTLAWLSQLLTSRSLRPLMECQEWSEFVTAMSCLSVILTSMLSAQRLCVAWLTSSRTTWAMGSRGMWWDSYSFGWQGLCDHGRSGLCVGHGRSYTVRDLHAQEISALQGLTVRRGPKQKADALMEATPAKRPYHHPSGQSWSAVTLNLCWFCQPTELFDCSWWGPSPKQQAPHSSCVPGWIS